jgi:hypothetical protein
MHTIIKMEYPENLYKQCLKSTRPVLYLPCVFDSAPKPLIELSPVITATAINRLSQRLGEYLVMLTVAGAVLVRAAPLVTSAS